MAESMRMADIAQQYRGEWVLLEDVESNELMEVVRGRVLWHSADEDEVSRKAKEFGARRSAIVFTGRAR